MHDPRQTKARLSPMRRRFICMHAYLAACRGAAALVGIHNHEYTHACIHTTYIHVHTRIRAYVHVHTHTRACIHVHTRTHAYIHVQVLLSSSERHFDASWGMLQTEYQACIHTHTHVTMHACIAGESLSYLHFTGGLAPGPLFASPARIRNARRRHS